MKFKGNIGIIGEKLDDLNRGVVYPETQFLEKRDNAWEITSGLPGITATPTSPTLVIVNEGNNTRSDYYVVDIPFDPNKIFLRTGRIYIGTNVTASTTFYNDLAYGAVQLISSVSGNRLFGWAFSNATDVAQWETYTTSFDLDSYNTAVEVKAYTETPIVNITSSTGVSRFSTASFTGSGNTGANDGISTEYGSAGSLILPAEGGRVPQVSDTNYIYRETSGSIFNSITWMRLNSDITLPDETIFLRVAYIANTDAGSGMTPDNTMWVGWA